MKRADIVAMFRRIESAFDRKNVFVFDQDQVEDLVLREVNRALRDQRMDSRVCLDCRTVVIPEPVLCEGCVGARNHDGISLDRMRRYS
jgi:hypothetical protein